MKTTGFLAALIIAGLSSLCLAYSGGDGTAGNPYQIADANDLLELAADASHYDKDFILTADIDLTGQTFTAAVIAPDMDDSNYDFDGDEFTGTLDGNTHQIKNFTINGGNNYYIGLLGQIGVDGQIKNLAIVNATIQGNYYVGGLVGGNYGIISSCYTTGAVGGNGCVGGLAGVNSSGTISFCHAAVSVDGIGSIGGLVGFNCLGILGYYESMIRFCYATGEVSGDSSVGGLVGDNNGGTIISCFATGAVNGYSDTGGLLGKNEISFMSLGSYETGEVVSCYAAGTVSGEDYVGGLLGANIASHVADSYSTGFVTGISNVGGLVGWSASFMEQCETVCNPSCVTTCNYVAVTDTSLVEYSFWNTITSGQTTSSGATGKTTAEMKTFSTFTDAGWDFTDETVNGTNDIWRMCQDGILYPKPSWVASRTGDFACPDGSDIQDLIIMAQNWLTSESVNPATFNYACDANGNGLINQEDFSKLGQYWPGKDFVQSGTVGECTWDLESGQIQTDGSESLRFNVTVQGRYILFNDRVNANCCKNEIQLRATAGSGLILLEEQVNVSMWCTCVCDFPVEAVLGPFEPGQYTFTVVQTENNGSGQVIGEVSVVIE
jgi:hypothetical protein